MTDEEQPNEVDRLKAELKAARTEAATNRKALSAINARLEGVDLDAYAEMKAAAENASKKDDEAKGNYEKLLADKDRVHEAAIKKLMESSELWKSKYETKAVDNELVAAAGIGKAVDANDAVGLIRSSYQFDIGENGEIEIRKGGEVLFDDLGKPIQPSALMSQFLKDKPHLVASSPNNGSGGNQQQQQASQGEKTTGQKVSDGLNALLGK